MAVSLGEVSERSRKECVRMVILWGRARGSEQNKEGEPSMPGSSGAIRFSQDELRTALQEILWAEGTGEELVERADVFLSGQRGAVDRCG